MENAAAEGINMTLFLILLAAGFVLFVVSLIVRARTGDKYEIRTVDLEMGSDITIISLLTATRSVW